MSNRSASVGIITTIAAVVALTTPAVATAAPLQEKSFPAGAAVDVVAKHEGALPTSKEPVSITAHDGVKLSAYLLRPTTKGKFPVVVMPGSWSMNRSEYLVKAKEMAARGFIVVSYTSRGFWESGGQIDIMGEDTQRDVSDVIDYALKQPGADSAKVGVVGISYGGGAGLLAAARDRRVKAVSSMSGFADLKESFYPNKTISSSAMSLLVKLGSMTGRPAPVLKEAQAKLEALDIPAAEAFLEKLSATRSASNKVKEINANGAAILIAHGTDDSFFPVNTMTDFYDRLTVPKRMLLAGGDHAIPDIPGLIGLPSDSWETTLAWMDHHLRGVANGVNTEPPAEAILANTRKGRSAKTVKGLVRQQSVSYLTGVNGDDRQPTGALVGKPSSGWNSSIYTGKGTVADSGTLLISGALQGIAQLPPLASMPLVDRTAGGVWLGEPLQKGAVVAGAPTVKMTVTPTKPNTTLFFYLYDVDKAGMGGLITAHPYTLWGATPGKPQTITVRMSAEHWEIKNGHRFGLVVDTKDPRWHSSSVEGGAVTFSSPKGAESSLTVPLG
ncbi:CocE/NonD family hydrolase [Austwickia chelonae]|uniref:CocE/NonD family hydrolase n=1 Tax=Austwickia chelonae TaxID=100225 RepID=UPI000E26DA4D|nr:CocE/NonD family hydrolase [Austwickia chelonae]